MNVKLMNKNFTLVVIGQIISLFGNGILRFALPLYLLRETDSAALFGLVTAASFLPIILLSFFGGVLADRVNKRNIMVFLDFLTASVVTTLFILLDSLPIVPLITIVLMLLYGIAGMYQPTVQASIPALVSTNHILTAGAIVNQISALSALLGPIIGGVLFATFGIDSILIVSIFCFVVSALMELFIDIPYQKRNLDNGIISIIQTDFDDSTSYIRKEKPMLVQIIGLVCLFNMVLTSLLMVGIPIIIIDILHLSDILLGVAQGTLALGGLCGGIVTAIFSKKLTLRQSPLILFMCSLLLGVMAIPQLLELSNIVCYLIITISIFLIMALATMFSIQMIATVQSETPPELIGKVIALMMAFATCAQPIGQAIYGMLFEIFSTQSAMILLVAALLSCIISIASRRIFHHNKV